VNEIAMNKVRHHDFTLGIPDGWKDRTEVVLKGLSRDGKNWPTVTVTRVLLEHDLTLAQFVDFQINALVTQAGVKESFMQKGQTTLDGLEASVCVFDIKVLGRWLTQRQIYAIRDKIAFIVVTTSPQEFYEADREFFDPIIKSFKFNPPAE
jgi:hypothetical protein